MKIWIIPLVFIFSLHTSIIADNNKNLSQIHSKSKIYVKKTEYKNALSYFQNRPTQISDETTNSVPKNKLFSPKRLIFTPNNDGKNDIAKIRFTVEKSIPHDQGILGNNIDSSINQKDTNKIELMIFNLNGYIVYSSIEPKKENSKYGIMYSFEWNGTIESNKPKIATMGVYIFAIKVDGDVSKELCGTITLVTDKNTLLR